MNWWKVAYKADGGTEYYNVLANTAMEAQRAVEVQLEEDKVQGYEILACRPTTSE